MSDERRVRVDDGDELTRARIHAARLEGGICAGCGRTLADGEPVWWTAFPVRGVYGRRETLRAAAGRECAPPALLRETAADEPRRCAGCGREIYYGHGSRPRARALCSQRCRSQHEAARTREGRKA